MSIKIQAGFSLKDYNTFGFDQQAEQFVSVHTDAELTEAVALARKEGWPIFILGGGSNVVLARDIEGLTIHPAFEQIRTIEHSDANATTVCAGAGLSWDYLVGHTLEHGLRGLENLTSIPGSVGAAPVQNIGAYGVELKDRVSAVRALHLASGEWQRFSNAECEFAYRDSYFKRHINEYVITEVEFLLGDCNALNFEYASLAKHLSSVDVMDPDARQISHAVAYIRSTRLPDTSALGNAGSFFHNPVVYTHVADTLREQYPDMPGYAVNRSLCKIPAAWLIEKLGFKGVRRGPVGVYEKQALVLVHYGEGHAQQLLELAEEIQHAAQERFGLELKIEPTLVRS